VAADRNVSGVSATHAMERVNNFVYQYLRLMMGSRRETP
jgi:hypothetical protein